MKMNIYSRKQRWKFLLVIAAVIIGVSSLMYTDTLVRRLSIEERKKVELWAEATRKLADVNTNNDDLGFLLKVIENNETVPVIIASEQDEVLYYRNLDTVKCKNPLYINRRLAIMKEENDPIVIKLSEEENQYIYYDNSLLLKKLLYYPYIQISVIVLFILASYFAFHVSRKAEQNQVWVGMSKETAHQLGTPISSLLAWLELLKTKHKDFELIGELEKDIKRLQKITERFSKVGSVPVLETVNLNKVLYSIIDYLKIRASDKVTFNVQTTKDEIQIPINSSLFEWVIENICKNAIDAINGSGNIIIVVKDTTKSVFIDIADNGKGIPKSKYKTIFKPGYTTKKRGWGLGLSLAKRIIENYHSGKIFVLSSDLEKGTTFRIVLYKS